MTKIYYAHSLKIFNTKREEEELARIKQQFPYAQIYNPNGDLIWRGKMQDCYDAINTCDCVIFSEYKGFVAKGTYSEVEYARINKKTVALITSDLRVRLIKKLEICDETDWKIKYSRVIL